MNVLGGCCARRAILLQSWQRPQHRSFTLSSPRFFINKSKPVAYPRWINSKQQSNSNDDNSESDSSSESEPPDSGDESSPPTTPPSSPPPPPSSGNIAKQSVPEEYPQVLALPIARRPLFPGFYKAVVIRNPSVVAAIKEMMKRGQPFLGAFLLKDESTDSDVIHDIDSVHKVGVFAQITSVFSPSSTTGEEEGLTAVLYPHRRIKITDLVTQPSENKPTGPVQTSFLHNYPISIAQVENLYTEPYNKDDQYIRAFVSEIVSVFKDIAQLNPLFRDQITNFSINQVASNVFDEPDKLADFAAAVSSGNVTELQDVLEALVVDDRLRKALLVLKKELINAQLQSKLSRDVDSKIAKRQREYYLMEQLKGIKKELGMESDGKDRLLEKFRERAAGLKMPEIVKKVFEEEMSKLSVLEPAASEANVTRNYLEWLTLIPWGKHSPENFSIARAQHILDEDHYGLSQVKSRILEFLAVGKLLGTVRGKIILLVGPPGVGKTSIGKSIARALNRQFFRFSVGGLTDVAEIKGHRRTYVGALPGKVVQALRRVGVENPLVLIDEVDKIGKGYNGDPASALLEMLDPEQNEGFLDHYMDLPINLSHTLFVCTANTLDTIPAPLLDRMEIIEVSGYVSSEKHAIAKNYLVPQAKKETGLEKGDVVITDDAVESLIRDYCRESGVRGLKKHIEKIYRKSALEIVKDLGEDVFPEPEPPVAASAVDTVENTTPPPAVSEETITAEEAPTPPPPSEDLDQPSKTATTVERMPLPIPSSVHVQITPENLSNYLGPKVYQKDRMYSEDPETSEDGTVKKGRGAPPGVSTGLGYLGNGSGSVMVIECVAMPGKGTLNLTGKLGEVIRESALIALSWIKAHAYQLSLTTTANDRFLEDRDVHIHMPEGSIGKEGPSAGTAILSAAVSLFLKRKVSSDIAMTGEITLLGQVLPVGGLKEKILAAQRAGIKTIIAPKANQKDIENEEEVNASVKEGIRFVYVERVEEVLEEVFGKGVLDPSKEEEPSSTRPPTSQ